MRFRSHPARSFDLEIPHRPVLSPGCFGLPELTPASIAWPRFAPPCAALASATSRFGPCARGIRHFPGAGQQPPKVGLSCIFRNALAFFIHHAQVVLRITITLRRRLLVKLECLCIVDLGSVPEVERIRQILLCRGVTLVGCPFEPGIGLLLVLGHASTAVVHVSKGDFCCRIPLFGGLAIPAQGNRVLLLYPLSLLTMNSQIQLRLWISLFSRLSIPHHCDALVFRDAIAIVI